MPNAAPDLRALAQAVTFPGPGRAAVSGEPLDLPDEIEARFQRVADALYQRVYCRPRPGPPPAQAGRRAAASFVERLSAANCGTGTWEPGWTVRAVERDGTLVVHRARDGLSLWAQPDQFRPRQGPAAPREAGRLRLGKELRALLPGYYLALGDADQEDRDSSPPMVRLYWHLTAAGAERWVAALTRALNGAAIPFHAKLHSDPAWYVRADAAVLYVARADLPRVAPLLPALHAAVAAHLRAPTPMLTRRLARGLSAAEDPGDGRSFGQHRCRLVAEGLLRDGSAGLGAVVARFLEAGLDPRRPWLAAGSTGLPAWPARGRASPQRRELG
jgi:class II lanthipeptide synthase